MCVQGLKKTVHFATGGRRVPMDDQEVEIENVDEVFESFVKKKLHQLGMKPVATETMEDTGMMTELEKNIKNRLEKNVATSDTGSGIHDSEGKTPKSPSKKAKKEKKHKKKKKKREREIWEERIITKTSEENNPIKEKEVGQSSSQEIKPRNKEKMVEEQGSDVLRGSKNTPAIGESEIMVENDTFSKPKKDIGAVKMKIEMLKAKSEGEQVKEELNGLLKVTTLNQSHSVKNKENCASPNQIKSAEELFVEKKRSTSQTRRHLKSHSRRRSHSRERRSRRHHRSRSPSKHRRSRSRDRHRRSHDSRRRYRRSRSPLISASDKVRLLEIAKANALAQHKASCAANTFTGIGQMVKIGSMSVKELTALCKDISSGKEEKASSSEVPKTTELDKGTESGNVHHPFAIRETPTFNIKPLKSLVSVPPVAKPIATLSKEFPVSCGQQHHRKEVLESVYGKWEIVAKDEATKKAMKELVTSSKVFVDAESEKVDLSSAIASRISAARLLQDDPNSKEAQEKMSEAQKALNDWTKSQEVVGQFTGSTGIQPMTKEVLEEGKQAWFKEDDLKKAKQVGGIGKSLLQKMGWTPGTPLGKTMVGQLEPVSLNFKNDRKGLSSFMEDPAPSNTKKSRNTTHTAKDLSDKHPVSALMEICSKRRWSPPDFSLVDPLNLKIFTFKVKVCDDEFVGKPASNKKQAKLLAATVALQSMGLLPKT